MPLYSNEAKIIFQFVLQKKSYTYKCVSLFTFKALESLIHNDLLRNNTLAKHQNLQTLQRNGRNLL